MAALQHGRYIGYGHLYFSSVDGRDKNVRLVAIITQMLIKSSDQALVSSGGDGLEKPLQAPILQLLNRPTCSFIIGELLFDDGKGVLQNELSALNRQPGYHASGPRGPRSRPLASSHFGRWLWLFVEHLVGTTNSKGLKTLPQIKPIPCKQKKTNPNNTRTLPFLGLCL
jgi:hypothetical protein